MSVFSKLPVFKVWDRWVADSSLMDDLIKFAARTIDPYGDNATAKREFFLGIEEKQYLHPKPGAFIRAGVEWLLTYNPAFICHPGLSDWLMEPDPDRVHQEVADPLRRLLRVDFPMVTPDMERIMRVVMSTYSLAAYAVNHELIKRDLNAVKNAITGETVRKELPFQYEQFAVRELKLIRQGRSLAASLIQTRGLIS